MKVLQINSTANTGSHGRIAEELGSSIIEKGWTSIIAYGRSGRDSKSRLIRIGSDTNIIAHGMISLLFDLHGFGSRNATKRFIRELESLEPDIVHLHNIHGYYLNVRILFECLERLDIPVIWTLHDCWPITGHCSYFDSVVCKRWQTGCYHCPNSKGYPKSLLYDNSERNYYIKKRLFTKPRRMIIVTPSEWLAGHVRCSYLGGYMVKVIYNGINISRFTPDYNDISIRKKYGIGSEPYILGVASIWDKRKGLEDFVLLRRILDPLISIALVGLNEKQMRSLPEGIKGISRTESIEELAVLYSNAEMLINPTWVDNFPTTNIEALACGTPIVTYDTGGSPEALTMETGIVVKKGEIAALHDAVKIIMSGDRKVYRYKCRRRAECMFKSTDRYREYLDLYTELLSGNK
ncbi:MAG: glycosyltransferase [Planctomycetes bacterium]|nr:glycosyltransferase [Planctomycetota bacterium]